MGRRRKEKTQDGPAGLPPWMATYSDLVTLLLTFFVLMMAMANFDDTQRVDAVMTSIRTAFGSNGTDVNLLQVSKKEAFTEDSVKTDTMRPVMAKLREAFRKHMSDAYMDLSETEKELRIHLDGKVFFKTGSSELHPAAYAIVAEVGKALADEPVLIDVEGFADGEGTEDSNWRLSTERAITVVMALRERGPIDGSRLTAAGHGAYHGGVKADRPEAWHRRVELVIRADDVAGSSAARKLKEGGQSGGR